MSMASSRSGVPGNETNTMIIIIRFVIVDAFMKD
jgi:hypothetical protein